MYSLDLIRMFINEFSETSECPERDVMQVVPLLAEDKPTGPGVTISNWLFIEEAVLNAKSVHDFSFKPHISWGSPLQRA